jgi:hypothetical protein
MAQRPAVPSPAEGAAFGITVESLLTEMRRQRERSVKLPVESHIPKSRVQSAAVTTVIHSVKVLRSPQPPPQQLSPAKGQRRVFFGRSSSTSAGKMMLEAAKVQYKALLDNHKRTIAAVCLQRWYRENRQRWANRRRERAQQRIAMVFSRCVFKLIARVRRRRRDRQVLIEQEDARLKGMTAGAVRLQSVARRWLDVRKYQNMVAARKRHEMWLIRLERRHQAVNTIARWFLRSSYGRYRTLITSARTLRESLWFQQRIAWHTHIRACDKFHRTVTDRHERSAVVIQASFRGHRTRSLRNQYWFLLRHGLPPVVVLSRRLQYREWMIEQGV